MSKRANISTANGTSNSKVRREDFEVQVRLKYCNIYKYIYRKRCD